MVSKPANLRNLIGTLLEAYGASKGEIEDHLNIARDHLSDAALPSISRTGSFMGIYNAAHGLTLAAFKIRGYRPSTSKGHRQGAFAALEHAVPATEADKVIFEEAHRMRNLAEYDGQSIGAQQSFIDEFRKATLNLEEEVRVMYKEWLRQPRT